MEFEQPLHVGAPNIGDTNLFFQYAEQMFERRWLTNHGELVLRFEKELRDYLGVKHCIAMCNGTVALEVAIRGLGLEQEVVVPSLTFVATAHALQWQGITPVFCDVDPDTLCIDPNEVDRRITPRTTGILGVHVFGQCCDVDALQSIADSNGVRLMFDAAHAFGNELGGEKIANFGECEVLSFHATKFFNSFEGGAVVTNNDELAEKIMFMQNFGFADVDRVEHIGMNGKMTEICAAMGLVNLRSIDEFMAANHRNHAAYADAISEIEGLRLIYPPGNGDSDEAIKSNQQYVAVEVAEAFPLRRDELMRLLHGENVLVRRYFWPGCHRMEPYRTLQPDAGRHLPVTETILERILLFPTGVAMNPEIIQRVFGLIKGWAG